MFLSELLTQGHPTTPGATAFTDVHEVLPGEVIHWDGDELIRSRTPFDPTLRSPPRSIQQWVDAFLHYFRIAVERCVHGDGDVAIMLSGGLDSGPTAALLHAAEPLHGRRFEAVSWSLDAFPNCNEERWIRRLAAELELPLRMFDGSRMLPFSRLSPELVPRDFPSYNIFRELINGCYQEAQRGGFDIVLNAAYGDQIYPEASMVVTDQFLRGKLISAMVMLARSIHRHGIQRIRSNPDLRRLAGLVLTRIHPARRFRQRKMPEWLPAHQHGSFNVVPTWPPELDRHPFPEHASWLAGPGMFFGTAHENSTMAAHYGLDRRDPFQDPDLIRLMWNLPAVLAWKDGKEKWIMREAMRGILPDWHRNKGRTGLLFEFHDRGRAANREHIKEFLGDQRAVWQDWFEPDYIESQLNQKGIDRKGELVVIRCIGYTLWRQHLREMGG